MNHKKEIIFYTARSRYLEDQIAFLKKQIDEVEGRLLVRFIKGKNRYYVRFGRSDNVGVYISPTKMEYLATIAQKEFNLKLIALYEDEKAHVDKWLSVLKSFIGPEDILQGLPDSYSFFCHIPSSDDGSDDNSERMTEEQIQKWLHQQFNGVPQWPDQEKELITMNHERVKSKSEVLVADRLFMKKLPYLYEKPLWLGRGEGYVFPDFTILNPKTGGELYWEHCGKMDDPNYLAGFMEKLGKYARAGHVLGKDLFMTFETSSWGLSTVVVDGIVDAIQKIIT